MLSSPSEQGKRAQRSELDQDKEPTMTTNSTTTRHFTSLPPARWQNAWQFNRVLALAILLHVAIVPLLLMGMAVDPKVIGGVNGWIKPLKFALSGGIYGATMLWMLTFVQGRRRWVQGIANVTGVALIVETALITLQVVRGTTSHFNAATVFDGIVFSIMGTFILLLSLAGFLLAIFLLFQRLPDPVVAWGLRWGLIIALAGMGSGALMTSGHLPPSSQAAVAAGEPVTVVGAHSVGVDDGGPGLPFLGWSTAGGDLRIGHFFGLHGLQVLPFMAFLLTRPAAKRRLTQRQRVSLIWIIGIGYLGLTILLTWQALRAQPLITPDGTTLLAVGLLATGVGVGVLLALAGGRHPAPHQLP